MKTKKLIKKDCTEPSGNGNVSEGVENRLYGLQLLKTMAMEAHERTLRLQKLEAEMICSDLCRNTENIEIKNSIDNNNVDLERAQLVGQLVSNN